MSKLGRSRETLVDYTEDQAIWNPMSPVVIAAIFPLHDRHFFYRIVLHDKFASSSSPVGIDNSCSIALTLPARWSNQHEISANRHWTTRAGFAFLEMR
jgi:hypothetical protein